MPASFARTIDRLRRYASSPRALLRSLRLLLQDRTVRRSPFFDRDWYLRENSELEGTRLSPSLHYLACGADAGKDPGPAFCGAEYLALHPDAVGMNPLVHYERIGRKRGYRVSFLAADAPFPTPAEHQAAFPAKVAAVREKAARGERVRAVFFVASAAMFPARPLFEAMRRDSRFDARIAVVPDLRGLGPDPEQGMERCRAALSRGIPDEAFLPVVRGADGAWPDILAEFGADIVCHPSPYELSDFRYNPRWCIGRPYLPIHVNYGYYRSVYDRHVMANRNYTVFWKSFFECAENLAEYREHSVLRGANAEVSGYVKMDPLASYPPPAGPRRQVLVCPHHSVEGGANDQLALSNFLRYADLFADLPARFPELDFLFRPHPFLFPVLERLMFWGPEKCAAWRSRFLAHPNARWSDGGDYFAEFAASNAIVQDCGSYLVEWLYTGRPCCYMLKSEEDFRKFSPLGVECLRHCRLAYGAKDIEAFLRDVVQGRAGDTSPDREDFRRRVMVHYPHAADAALDAIRRDLGLD